MSAFVCICLYICGDTTTRYFEEFKKSRQMARVHKTHIELYHEFCLLKPALNGHGRKIARAANVHYNTYLNYSAGFGTDPRVWDRIIEAAKKEARLIYNQLKPIFNDVG